MKFSKFLLLIAVSLSATSHAQTSQTYYFGEGQNTPQRGHATSSPPVPAAGATQPLPPGEPHPQAQPNTKPEPKAKSKPKSKHKPHHRHATTHHAPHQDLYSRP
jgi:outer membrane biosynthesis protein TonB